MNMAQPTAPLKLLNSYFFDTTSPTIAAHRRLFEADALRFGVNLEVRSLLKLFP